MWEIVSDWNWELIIALGALALSGYTFYVQNVKAELAIYPSEEDDILYVIVENAGKSSVKDYTLQVVGMKNVDRFSEGILTGMKLTQRQASFSLAPNRTTTFPIANKIGYVFDGNFPIVTFNVYNAKGRKVDTFTCDFNMYHNQLS
ncbi:hypothetical protein [Exiguobacterium sp. s142]|uniref:hypothetical protein n=1 Tax=Exiguobacterium sp. s142 TaxID=2751222 RepID=UPI001BE74A2F|nr:hypothetical protein [Exiguobacterium sp. s142]